MKARRPSHTPPHQVRIIGGRWRRTPLPVPNKEGLRPTPSRVRETLFNWLGGLDGWRVIDAFAGSGALGLEAASRGSASVLLVERDARLAASLRTTAVRLKADNVQVRCGDGIAALSSASALDLALLDPPFDAGLFDAALAAAAAAVRAGGFIYLEAPRQWETEALAALGLTLHRHTKAGEVHAHLLVRAEPY